MKASLKLIRDTYTNISTIGKLYLNGVYICETLEDPCRDLNHDGDLNDNGEQKIFGDTAIPCGKYKFIINVSNRFKKLMPLLLDVKGYEGVRIHSGNRSIDTEGCILVGLRRGINEIFDSRQAFMKLMNELLKNKEFEIEIVDK